MGLDIQFGDLEEAQPEPRLRPDQDMHFAVVPCMNPVDGELPIYVDVDAAIDIETHAKTDTSVELGGVLLGGQYEDQDGKPFVVVHDCLRAEHYEATKGSFKFTHETWEQITRQREEFSDEFEMVGWYHTHPDWGVFLSGMDMFICDNFFNRPLDVALVVDPCKEDRGWFQWTGDPSERVRRTGGFYLVGSRFRQYEIEQVSAALGGNSSMSFDPRVRPIAGQIGSPSPVVNIHDRQNPIQQYALLGMLVVQFLFVAVIAWKILAPTTTADEVAEAKQNQTAVLEELQRIQAADDSALRIDAQREILELLAARVSGEPVELVRELEQSQVDYARTLDSLDGQITVSRQLRTENKILRDAKNEAEKEVRDLSVRSRAKSDRIDELLAEVDEYEKGEGGAGATPFYKDWRAILVGGVLMAISIGCGFAIGMNYRRYESDFDDGPSDFEPSKMESFSLSDDVEKSEAPPADPPSTDEGSEDDSSPEKAT